MRTIAFLTQKGGAGKTTLAASLAAAAVHAGETVIALDLDPQASLLRWGKYREATHAPNKVVIEPLESERLQVLLSHERAARERPDLLSILREELIAVIGRHVSFEPDKVQIKMDRGKSVSTLAVDIEIPNRDGVLGAVSR